MKIKEIIAKTDLTDRAIRLYIENGLVSPSITENYSGRKNIEFSHDDLVTLQNIATLRKADFSIAEIKSIIESPSECKRVLESFLTNKHERIEADTKIVEALSPLLNSEEPDINSICENLNAVTADKPVPEADTKTPLWEKIEKWRLKRYPDSTEYYYRYVKSNNYYSELYAQWRIPGNKPLPIENPPYDELDLMIEKYKSKKALNGEAPIYKVKGTWNLIYYADHSETEFSEDYEYIIFAYNKDRRLVRFIQAQNGAGKYGGNDDVVPHYLTLDWYS